MHHEQSARWWFAWIYGTLELGQSFEILIFFNLKICLCSIMCVCKVCLTSVENTHKTKNVN